MSLLTLDRASLQKQLFEPEFWACAQNSRKTIVVILSGFFCLCLSAFGLSLLRVAPAAAADTTTSVASMAAIRPLEMHIASNGLVLLRSAKVVAVQGKTLTVDAAWGSMDFQWTIRTNAQEYETRHFGTRFLNREGKKISPRDVRVGDLVTITGMLDGAAAEPTLDADSVRNLE